MTWKQVIVAALIGGSIGLTSVAYSKSKFNYARAVEAARQMGFPAEDSYQHVFAEGARWQSQQN